MSHGLDIGRPIRPEAAAARALLGQFLSRAGPPPGKVRERCVLFCYPDRIAILDAAALVAALQAKGGEEPLIAFLTSPVAPGRLRVVLTDDDGNWQSGTALWLNTNAATGAAS